MRASRLCLGVAAVLAGTVGAAPAWAFELKDGTYRVKGSDSKKGSYAGEVELSRTDATHAKVRGVYVPSKGGKESFTADATIEGDKLRFKFDLKSKGFLAGLGSVLGASKPKKVEAVYTIGDGSLAGVWTASNDSKFRREDTWSVLVTSIDRVEPRSLELGARGVKVTILGRDLAALDLSKSDVGFLLDGKDDGKLKVVSIGERADDGSRLEVRVDVDKTASIAKRGVRVSRTTRDDVLEVVMPGLQLPLGGWRDLGPDDRAVLVVPLAGGVLTLEASSGTVKLEDPSGRQVAGDLAKGVAIDRAGDYRVTVTGALTSAAKVWNTYSIDGETRPENKPYNFWYFPFVESRSKAHNLFSDGGAYEKLDGVFGLAPSALDRFDESRHMDARATGEKRFKLPTDAGELARYTPSTVKGYAWCYQRSTDSDKGWWGHCWGAVIASSLHRRPQAVTIASVASGSVSFSEEEAEGILSAYYSNHEVQGNFYVSRCPPGRPTEKTGEPVDARVHDLWRGLVDGIKKQGLPLASNLRAESTDDSASNQVWNHVIWKFTTSVKRAPDQNDPSYLELAVKVYATNDVFPSTESQAPRIETWVLRLRCKDGQVVPNAKDQNFVSATHFAPSYVARITGSSSGDLGCENEALGRIGIDGLEKKLGYTRMGSP